MTISRRTMTPQSYHPQPTQTNQLAFSNSGKELFLTTEHGHVKIVDYPSFVSFYHPLFSSSTNVQTPIHIGSDTPLSQEHLHTLTPHTSATTTLAVCPRGRHLATGGSDALIALHDMADFSCKHSLLTDTQPGPVRSLSFSFDGRFLVAGGDDAVGGSGTGVAGIGGIAVVCTFLSSSSRLDVQFRLELLKADED